MDDLHALDTLVAENRERRGAEAQADDTGLACRIARGELAQDLDVPPNDVRRSFELRLARRIELELGRIDDDVRAGELTQLAQLGRRPRRLDGAAAAEHDDLADARADDRVDRRVRRVGRSELILRQREHPRDVESDVPVPDDHGAFVREVELELLEVGVAVVPGDQLGGRPRAGEVLSRDTQPTVGLRADRIDDCVVERSELVLRDVPSHLHVAEEAEARPRGDLLERARHGLELRMIRRDPEPDKPPGRGQPLDHVDLDLRILARKQSRCRVEGGRPGAHDPDAQRGGHESILERSCDAASASSRSRSRRPRCLRAALRLLPPGRSGRSRTRRRHSGCRS